MSGSCHSGRVSECVFSFPFPSPPYCVFVLNTNMCSEGTMIRGLKTRPGKIIDSEVREDEFMVVAEVTLNDMFGYSNFAVLLNARASIALNTGYRKIGVLTLGVEQHTGIRVIQSSHYLSLIRSLIHSLI